MYPYIHLIIPSYAALALIGGFVALCYVYFRNDNVGLPFTELLKIFLYGILGVFIGSKLLFAITQIPWLVDNFSIENLLLLIPQSGYVFYGGLFGFIFAICFISKGNREYRRKVFNLLAPAFPLFHVFGRIGCFLAGCCYGRSLEQSLFIWNIEIDRIPVQLIEALIELIIFVILCMVGKRNKKVDLLAVYLIMYAMIRFVLEFFRGDFIRGVFVGLSTSQYISMIIILFYLDKKVLRRLTAHRKNLI